MKRQQGEPGITSQARPFTRKWSVSIPDQIITSAETSVPSV